MQEDVIEVWELGDTMITGKKILLLLYMIIRMGYLFKNVKKNIAFHLTEFKKSAKNKHVSTLE